MHFVLNAFRGPVTLFIVATRNEPTRGFQNIICCYSYHMTKNERGRPPKADDERKDAELRIRMTREERERMDQAADGKTSTWARDVLVRAAKRKLK